MAVYPCDYSRHRYRQPQQSLYYTEISEHLVSTYKVRLCPQHFDDVTELLREHLDDIEDNTMSSDKCQMCGEDRLFTVQARIFALKTEEEQRIADLCASCASLLGNEAHVYNGEHLRDTRNP